MLKEKKLPSPVPQNKSERVKCGDVFGHVIGISCHPDLWKFDIGIMVNVKV